MPGTQWPRRMVLLGLLGVAAVTLAVPCVLLARDTTRHDWYAAGKLTTVEIALAAGADEYAAVAYRRKRGDTWKISRTAFVEFEPPLEARRRILATVGDGLMLGAGVGGTVFCLMLFGALGHARRDRIPVTALEPAESRFRHPSASSPALAVEDWARPGLRMRIALLVVSPADLECLLAPPGPTRRPGFIDLPGPDSPELAEGGGELLEGKATPSLPPPTRPAGLPSPERAESAAAGSGRRPDKNNPDGTTGDKAAAPRRKPGEDFF